MLYRSLAALILFIFLLTGCKKDEIPESDQSNDSFEVFWSDFDETYPYFIHKNINWDTIYSKYSALVSPHMGAEELFDILGEMSLELRDIHVYLESSFNSYHYSKKQNYPENPPNNAINYLENVWIDNSRCVMGDISNTGYSYLRIKSFVGPESYFSEAVTGLDTIPNRDGLIIDIRHNGGGNETIGMAFAGRFTTEEKAYKNTRVRAGAAWDSFTEWHTSTLSPDDPLSYNKKIILLTNRRVYSSAELFILMMKTYPELIIVGDTSGGASANPAKRELPNGWEYYVSTWQAASLEYKLIEDNGIAPDHYVLMTESSISEGKDLILEKAIELLNNTK